MRDAGLGLFLLGQFDEVLALQRQQPLFVHQRAAIHFATAQHGGDAHGDLVVVRADEAAFQHVDQHHLERGDADVTGDLDAAGRHRRTVATFGQRQHFGLGDVQRLEAVEHNLVGRAHQAQFLGVDRRVGDLGHRDGFEGLLELGEHITAGTCGLRGAHGQFLQATAGRQQTDAGFDQADVAFQRGHALGTVHLELTAAAQGQAAHGGHHRHQRILDRLAGALEVVHHLFELVHLAGLQQAERTGQIGTGGEGLLLLPDHQALVVLLGALDRFLQAVEHVVGHGVHLGLEADHRDAVAVVPHAHAVVLEHGFARAEALAQQRIREALALVHRQGRTRQLGIARRAVAAFGGVHAVAAIKHPVRQRGIAHALAGDDVIGDPLRDLLPAGRLPGFERAQRPAVPPADGQIHVARGLGDIGQVVGAVVEQIAEGRPQELRLRVLALAQLGELLGRVLDLQDLDHFRCGGAVGGAVVLLLQVQHHDVLADLAEDAGTGLLAQRALGNQRVQPLRRVEEFMPRIVGQGVAHGLDHVRHGVQADHIGGAIGRRLRAADQRAGQAVDFVEAQAECLRVVDGGQDREHADAVADEVRGVLGIHHALAQGGDQERFQAFEHGGIGGGRRDQLGQVHVARRIEEVHAAEAVAQLLRQYVSELVDAQAGGVGGQHGVIGHERGDLLVQVLLPVHPFGDGFDDQVAVLQLLQAGLIVGRRDRLGVGLAGERGRAELAQVGDGLEHDAIGRTFLGGQVEQHGVDAGVGQVGGDLGTHDAGTQHGGTAN